MLLWPQSPVATRSSLAIFLLLVASLTVYLSFRSRSAERHKRGTVVRSGASAQRRGRRARHRDVRTLTLADVAIPSLDETKHFKLIGTTGTGKSTAIREILNCALERGDRAIIADPDGGYCNRFFRRYRGDIILNPFQADSVQWHLFDEIRESYDVEQVASGLIPSVEDSSGEEWRGYARTFLTAVLRRCHQQGRHDTAELWRLLAVASTSELRPLIAGTPAQPFLDPENARMFGSIRSVTGSAIAALEYIQAQRAKPFSVRYWVNQGKGALFIPYQARQIAALRSIIATWLRLAIFETMSQAENRDQRLWFIIDELDALGPIDGLKDALARLRKFGGRCVLGFQSIAQVAGTYGPQEAQTIIENCGTTLILRCSSSDGGGTAQFASQLIGEREIIRRQTTRGHDRENPFSIARRSTNISEQHLTEPAVMPSEIEQLPDLAGYLKSASSPEWLRVRLHRASY